MARVLARRLQEELHRGLVLRCRFLRANGRVDPCLVAPSSREAPNAKSGEALSRRTEVPDKLLMRSVRPLTLQVLAHRVGYLGRRHLSRLPGSQRAQTGREASVLRPQATEDADRFVAEHGAGGTRSHTATRRAADAFPQPDHGDSLGAGCPSWLPQTGSAESPSVDRPARTRARRASPHGLVVAVCEDVLPRRPQGRGERGKTARVRIAVTWATNARRFHTARRL